MSSYTALLRAVNVGGTGKLEMPLLLQICSACGFERARTYIASGDVVFESEHDEGEVRTRLEDKIEHELGKRIGVFVRTGEEMAAILAANPFRDAAPNRTVAIFLDGAPPNDLLTSARGFQDERIAPGVKQIYVAYGANMGRSKLKIPCALKGTARNLNTVATLARTAPAGRLRQIWGAIRGRRWALGWRSL